jgi:copper(I)-binding protein
VFSDEGEKRVLQVRLPSPAGTWSPLMLRRRLLLAPAALALLRAPLAGAQATGGITVEQAWSRPTAAGMPNGAAYLVARNAGSRADRLVGATSEVAERVELHGHTIDAQGVAMMRPVEAIEVPAGGQAELRPGGLHLMLLGLRAPLAEGTSFPLRLRFAEAGEVEVTVSVGRGPGGAAGHTGHLRHGAPSQP